MPAFAGIVLMHGKWGSPDKSIVSLASALEGKGFLASTPEMPWSRRRSYDKSADDALNEIDAEVAKLRDKGARRNVESVKPGTLVLWVEPLGEEPPLRNNLMRIFKMLPQGLDVKLVEPDADHMSTPDRATGEIVNGIESVVSKAPAKN